MRAKTLTDLPICDESMPKASLGKRITEFHAHRCFLYCLVIQSRILLLNLTARAEV